MKVRFLYWMLFVLVVGFIGSVVLFTTTSVRIERSRDALFVDSSSPVSVRVVALNKLGFRIPFKHLKGQFVVREGADRIRIVETGQDELVFMTTNMPGRLEIFYYTRSVPFPVDIVFYIESASVASLEDHILSLS